ncbi:MAG TPA: response regulator, partial [Chroococcales cyanobacterium]
MSEVSLIAILVIEDSPTFAKVIEAMLQRHSGQPTRVEVAHTLNAGLQKLMSMRFDLVLLDLSLPDSEGLAALQSVQRENPSVPIIILSGIEDEALALTALNAGAQDYLLKGETNARTLNRAVAYGIARSTLRGLEAERLRLFEQREDFMATLTHDLKNPLIGANRILELMIDQQLGTLPEQHIRLLSKLRDSNIALLGMIRNLIEVYRYEKDVQTMVCEAT